MEKATERTGKTLLVLPEDSHLAGGVAIDEVWIICYAVVILIHSIAVCAPIVASATIIPVVLDKFAKCPHPAANEIVAENGVSLGIFPNVEKAIVVCNVVVAYIGIYGAIKVESRVVVVFDAVAINVEVVILD